MTPMRVSLVLCAAWTCSVAPWALGDTAPVAAIEAQPLEEGAHRVRREDRPPGHLRIRSCGTAPIDSGTDRLAAWRRSVTHARRNGSAI